MGQYHLTVNLDKREFLDPHELGEGLKLWEQAWSKLGIGGALHMLLAVSDGRGGGDYGAENHGVEGVVGRWGGDRIAIVGDYAEEGDLNPDDHADVIYDLCGSAEDIERAIANLKENPYWQANPEEAARRIKLLETEQPYTDITLIVRDALQVLVADYENKTYQGPGWGQWVEKEAV